MAKDIIIQICDNLREWVNHTKEGSPRLEIDLVKFDKLWLFLRGFINNLECKCDINEEEQEFLSLVKYTGRLYRVHRKYNQKNSKFGIKEMDHYVSWSKSNSICDFYWLYESHKFITISATADEDNFGIDIVGLSEYLRKYYVSNFYLGSPALLKEQEVVFPIKFELINEIKVNPLGK